MERRLDDDQLGHVRPQLNPSCGTPVGADDRRADLLCSSGNPTKTDVPGGTLGATGAETVKPVSDPMPPTDVAAGSYIVTATDPPGYTLVSCHGSGIPALNGLSATETVAVPSRGQR